MDREHKQELSDKFWKTYFPDLIGKPLTELEALQNGFWEQYQTALEASDADTNYAIVLAKPAIQVTTDEIYMRIITTAKSVWNKQIDPRYQKNE